MWLIVYSNDHAPLTVRPIYSSSKLRTAQMMIFSLVLMIGFEKCCITSACLQWLCHSGERTVARGPLVSYGILRLSIENAGTLECTCTYEIRRWWLVCVSGPAVRIYVNPFMPGRAPVAYWIGELTLNSLGFSPLWFEPRSGHMWESHVLLKDGLVFFPGLSGFLPSLMNDRLDIVKYSWKGCKT